MFSITKKIIVAAGMLAFCSGQFDAFAGQFGAFGSETDNELDDNPGRPLVIANTENFELTTINDDDESGRQHAVVEESGFQALLPDVKKLILKEASEGTNPRHLASICKHWYSIMRETNDLPQGKELYYSINMNGFMKGCMETFWASQFDNGALLYKPNKPRGDDKELTWRVSDLKDGTFDLSSISMDKRLVITTNIKRFFQVGETDVAKLVVLVVPRFLVEKESQSTKNHPLASTLDPRDADKAPVVIYWRWDDFNKNKTLVDYLTTRSATSISEVTLRTNWEGAIRPPACQFLTNTVRDIVMKTSLQNFWFSCSFCKPELGL